MGECDFLKHDAILLKAGDEWEANRIMAVAKLDNGASELTLARKLKTNWRGENHPEDEKDLTVLHRRAEFATEILCPGANVWDDVESSAFTKVPAFLLGATYFKPLSSAMFSGSPASPLREAGEDA